MVSQLLVNALIAGSVYALVGVGFSLIFQVVRFFHFTHGLTYSLGAYATFTLNVWLGLPIVPAVAIAVTVASLTGLVFDMAIFAPLRARGSSALVSLLASLGLYVVGQNLLSMTFGDGARSIREYVVTPGMEVLGARITVPQLVIVCSAAAVVIVTAVWLSSTRFGGQIRAVAEDRELAAIVGIPTARVMAMAVAVGAALGGLAGILSALDRDMVPTMGMNALLMGVVAMIVGGQAKIAGVALGGLLVGLAQNLGVLWIPSAWQDAIVFVILLIFLLLRPEGFLGKPLRRTTV